MKKKCILILFCLTAQEYAKSEDDINRSKEGNLLLLPSQQPGPLISFGQNVVQKESCQLFTFANYARGHHQKFVGIIPGILYGINDDLSIFLNFPVVAYNKINNHHAAGISDIFAQLEYAVYNKDSVTSVDQITLVGNLTVPTGSTHTNPQIGLGSPSVFLGITASHLSIDWYVFTSYGALLTTKHNDSKFGDQFFYQGGFGRNIVHMEDWIFMWMAELDGFYSQHNRRNTIIDQQSGSNIIYFGPSLWLSSERLVLQGGISFVVFEHLCGRQPKNNYLVAFNVGWSF